MGTTGGINALSELMATLQVTLQSGGWRFETGDVGLEPDEAPVMVFQEREGPTHILPANQLTPADNRWSWIEVSVHSDLNAVGFLAELARALAEVGIPCNAIAAYFHDHIFVPEHRAEEAITALRALRQ